MKVCTETIAEKGPVGKAPGGSPRSVCLRREACIAFTGGRQAGMLKDPCNDPKFAGNHRTEDGCTAGFQGWLAFVQETAIGAD